MKPPEVTQSAPCRAMLLMRGSKIEFWGRDINEALLRCNQFICQHYGIRQMNLPPEQQYYQLRQTNRLGFGQTFAMLLMVLIIALAAWHILRQENANDQLQAENILLSQKIYASENRVSELMLANDTLQASLDDFNFEIEQLSQRILRLIRERDAARDSIKQLPPEEMLALFDELTGQFGMSVITLHDGTTYALIDMRRISPAVSAMLSEIFHIQENELLRQTINYKDSTITALTAINLNSGLIISQKDSIIGFQKRQLGNCQETIQQLRREIRNGKIKTYVVVVGTAMYLILK
jgi:uncharacterized FlaG/YvyC family protein